VRVVCVIAHVCVIACVRLCVLCVCVRVYVCVFIWGFVYGSLCQLSLENMKLKINWAQVETLFVAF